MSQAKKSNSNVLNLATKPAESSDLDLTNPKLYINRELSLLEFNRRVFAQAKNRENPLLERLRFLCIANRNLDEFFEIRVAGLKQQIEYGSLIPTGPDNITPEEALARVSEVTHDIVDEQYDTLNNILLPELEVEGIRFFRREQWTGKLEDWVRRYFVNDLLPVLTPIGLDPAHPFPRVLNKNLNFIVSLEGKDAYGRDSGLAVVQAPRSLSRLIKLPANDSRGDNDYVFLSSVIHAHIGELFPGMKATGCYQFRVTRNSDLFVDEEEIDDLLHAIRGELGSRRYGDAVRVEVADNCPKEISNFLLKEFDLEPSDLYRVNGPVNLSRLIQLPELANRLDLCFRAFTPALPRHLRADSLFHTISNGDILLHHPFESFAPVIDLVRQAAVDPDVLAIKMTLYRTGPDSVMVDALVDAARAEKEVTVVIELRARFDEEANIELATRLQEAGALVVYGIVGHKTHAKLLLIVRRERKQLKRYAHLGTGNYHASTSRLYTDIGLITANKLICEDVHKLFQQLTGLGKATKLKKLLQSPFTLHKTMVDHIRHEAELARTGKRGHIIAKMNSLVEPQIIRELYLASNAGVSIDLIIRGICCLRPGVKGVSENIRVRSIVGRFLEHSRIFYFENDGESEIYCSSADWMDRNFFRRVESCVPILDENLAKRLLKEGLQSYLKYGSQSWILETDGTYNPHLAEDTGAISAQTFLLEKLTDFGPA